jgi:hypothetical protein
MKKIITFCLFGDCKDYFYGAIENARLAQTIYPEWICRFYIFKEVFSENPWVYGALLGFKNTEVVKLDMNGGFYSTMYRFLPLGETDVDVFMSRDCDSRLSNREKVAVDEWLVSGKTNHIMHDHPYHYTPEYPILAGMWGSKGGWYDNIKDDILRFYSGNEDKKGIDQKFLYYFYHNHVKNDVYITDTFSTERDFEKDGIWFVGQAFDQENKFAGDWKNDLKLIGVNV